MAQGLGASVKTFSIGFQEEGYNELPYARKVAELFGSEHHELMARRGHDLLEDVLAAVDEPFADPSSIPTFLVSRLAGRHLKVVLSGDGGDEIFAGYERYVVDYRRRHLGRLGDWGLGAPLRAVSRRMPEGTPGKNYLYHLSLPRIDRTWTRSPLPGALAARGPAAGGGCRHGDVGVRGRAAGRPRPGSALTAPGPGPSHLSAGDILTKVDRNEHGHSLEARVPLPITRWSSSPARCRRRCACARDAPSTCCGG